MYFHLPYLGHGRSALGPGLLCDRPGPAGSRRERQAQSGLRLRFGVQPATFYQGLRDGYANMSTTGSGLFFLDPQVVLVLWFGKDTLRNPHNWENTRFTELMALEARETNQEVRRGHFKEMAQILNQGESHYVPLYWVGRAGSVNYHIQNFRPPYHPHTIWKWDQIWWDPDAKIRGPDAPPIR